MRITSFLLANAPRYYITQRNNESGQRKGLLNLVFLPVKIHSSRVTIERVCRVRVGEELREEALKNVWEIIQCCPGLVNHVQADCAWHLIDVRVVDLKEKTRFSLTPPGIIFSCWKQQRRNSTLDFLWLHKSFRKEDNPLEFLSGDYSGFVKSIAQIGQKIGYRPKISRRSFWDGHPAASLPKNVRFWLNKFLRLSTSLSCSDMQEFWKSVR